MDKLRLVVGRDTPSVGPHARGRARLRRLSAGADVFAVGVLPTPGIAHLTPHLDAHGGVVISASHNPRGNGIQDFSSTGSKFPDAGRRDEVRLGQPDGAPKPTVPMSAAVPHRHASEAEYAAQPSARSPSISAARTSCWTAPTARPTGWRPCLRGAGARVTVLAAEPAGRISTSTAALSTGKAFRSACGPPAPSLGLAFDGDGDRLICVDERRGARRGLWLACCARHWRQPTGCMGACSSPP